MKHSDHFLNIKTTAIKNIRRSKLKCHICKKRFKNKIDLQEHIQTHGLTNIQNSCFTCHATFQTDTELLTHLSEKHKTKHKKYLCKLCGYSTSKTSHYKQHTNTHTSINQQKCSYCDYTTNHPPNLRIHERIHTNDKPYTCNFNSCGYQCATKSALRSHELQHDRVRNTLYCDQCSYKTVYRQSLKKHLDSHRRNSVRTKY
ncbi:unnamed protein product [Chrysodeixis includens]|uniref:C2H2-type domain-containing protein n=1 Tax=Chrysodeixis includens TaxID=689277 RepID=A0A9N8Q0S5_CHRIL|nr:unnamed protein product [Chrysodeixis includens]